MPATEGGASLPASRGVVPEVRLAVAGARAAALAALAVSAVAALTQEPPVALGAALGAGIVAVLSVAGLPLYWWAAHRRVQVVVSAAVAAIVLRLGLAAVLLAVVARFVASSVPALAVGCVVTVAAMLLAEATVAARDPRLFWIDPAARERPAA